MSALTVDFIENVLIFDFAKEKLQVHYNWSGKYCYIKTGLFSENNYIPLMPFYKIILYYVAFIGLLYYVWCTLYNIPKKTVVLETAS